MQSGSPERSELSTDINTDLEANKYIPPWKSPYVIGIAGLSGSGKTTVAQKIVQQINEPWTVLLSMDNFYKPLSPESSAIAFENEYDFDTPEALDLNLLFECVKSLKEGKRTEIPIYSFAEHQRTEKSLSIYGANVIVIEGIYSLYNKNLLKYMDCKIYVDTDIDICYSRRLLRDIVHRGRDLEGIIKQWDKFVKPNSVSYVLPTMKSADVVIPRGSDNKIAIEMVLEHIRKQLLEKSADHVKHLQKLGKKIKSIDYNKVHVLPTTNQLLGIKTILLNRNTSNNDFIFYFNRVAMILIYEALELVSYIPGSLINKYITTPVGVDYKDSMFQQQDVIAVDIIRSGDCFIPSLKKTIPEVRLGKLLIQSDLRTGEPQLHTEKLPKLDGKCKILLFDAQTISGAAAIMAMKILLDHGVSEKEIVLVTYMATEVSVRRILDAFSQVNIVVANMSSSDRYKKDTDHDSDWWMSTRFIDDRYFGTE